MATHQVPLKGSVDADLSEEASARTEGDAAALAAASAAQAAAAAAAATAAGLAIVFGA